MKYNAFLSYSHGQDTELGTSLEKGLEKFAKPTFKRRALEIFRDANDLSVAADLGDKIRNGLENSEYFICMASQKYAQSKWCQREVDYWLENKSIEKFLIVLTDGEILWDEAKNDFDWRVTTAIPKNLSGAFKGEPFFVDFRNLGSEEKLNLDNPEFENRLVVLAATLHGKSIGDMVGEAAKQHKRTMRIRNATIGILSVLLVIAISASIYAVNQRDSALLSTYISNSQGQLAKDPTKSLRLAEHAYTFSKKKNFSSEEATQQLIRVFYSGYGFYQESSPDFPDFREKNEESLSSTGTPFFQDMVAVSEEIFNTIPRDTYLRNVSDLYVDEPNQRAIYVVSSVALGYSKIFFISPGYDGYYQTEESSIFLTGFSDYTGYVQDIEISHDGKYTLLGSANGKTGLIDNEAYRTGGNRNTFKDLAILKSGDEFPVSYLSFLEDNQLVGIASYESEYVNGDRKDKERTVYYYKTMQLPYLEIPSSEMENETSTSDGLYELLPLEEGEDSDAFYRSKKLISLKTGEILAEFSDSKGFDLASISSPDGMYLASYRGLFNAENELIITFNLDRIDNPGITLAFSEDSKFLKISYSTGAHRIFPLDPEFILNRINDLDFMGKIDQLNEADKGRFLIED
ncbi:toll/interleukin-1 receptor domain-containing protein [Algoriphagus marinus]|uniref:toll/interleukin-1 receptor domain-containing protein n=1 Tax=Algoriphagus marinus TaxID=1925762 RepID=UPI00094BAC2D|nr:toll/interleukin-1 receptor domain-containing protein [Algoriphagus marinus]